MASDKEVIRLPVQGKEKEVLADLLLFESDFRNLVEVARGRFA